MPAPGRWFSTRVPARAGTCTSSLLPTVPVMIDSTRHGGTPAHCAFFTSVIEAHISLNSGLLFQAHALPEKTFP